MGQDEGLQAENQVFVRRKNIVVGELDLAIEVLAAALGVELNGILWRSGFHLMIIMMPHAMHALGGGITEATHDVMVFGTIVELHVPTDRDKQHR